MYHVYARQTGATKARALLIFFAIIVAISAIVVAYSFQKKDPLEKKPSSTTSIPSTISNVPGEQTSEKYKELQLEENRLKAQAAKKEGISAIPTLTSTRQMVTPIPSTAPQSCQSCCCAGGNFSPTDVEAALGLADTDPEAFKRLMLENPDLAKRLAQQNPELFKKLMREDPNFAGNFAHHNPDVLTALLSDDPAFARTLATLNPDLMKTLIAQDPNFAEQLAGKNGDLLRKLMKMDPNFAKQLTKNNPALVGELKREDVPTLDPAVAARLIGEIQKSPAQSLNLLKANPGLAKAISETDTRMVQKDPDHTKLFLGENPSLATFLAKQDPNALKRLLLANPALATKLAHDDPAAFKALLDSDPSFMTALASTNPDLVNEWIKEDPNIAKKMASLNPAFLKSALLSNPQLASALQAQNPDLLTDLIKNDLAFSKQMASTHPAVVKALLKNALFAEDMAKRNPSSLKALMAGDPIFTRQMANNSPNTVKALLKLDPDFAKLLNERTSDILKGLFQDDPLFAREFLNNNPSIKVAGLNLSQPGFGVSSNPLVRSAQEAQKTRDDRARLDRQRQMSEAYQKGLDELSNNMQAQLSSATKIWSEPSALSYTFGKWADPNHEGSPTGAEDSTSKAPAGPKGPVLVKAGTILFAVIDTAINSDEPGPILATIVSENPLKGSKVMGEIKSSGNKAESLTLNFSTLNMQDYPATVDIKAVAVDPDTSRTSLASNVDHHYLLRYGTLLASTFMTGYSKVITSQGTVNTTATNGGTTTTTTPPLSGKKEILAALGDVGKGIGTAFADNINRPNTITIDAGTSVGLLFLGDVNEPQP